MQGLRPTHRLLITAHCSLLTAWYLLTTSLVTCHVLLTTHHRQVAAINPHILRYLQLYASQRDAQIRHFQSHANQPRVSLYSQTSTSIKAVVPRLQRASTVGVLSTSQSRACRWGAGQTCGATGGGETQLLGGGPPNRAERPGPSRAKLRLSAIFETLRRSQGSCSHGVSRTSQRRSPDTARASDGN